MNRDICSSPRRIILSALLVHHLPRSRHGYGEKRFVGASLTAYYNAYFNIGLSLFFLKWSIRAFCIHCRLIGPLAEPPFGMRGIPGAVWSLGLPTTMACWGWPKILWWSWYIIYVPQSRFVSLKFSLCGFVVRGKHCSFAEKYCWSVALRNRVVFF
jgi:hypothetical protein